MLIFLRNRSGDKEFEQRFFVKIRYRYHVLFQLT